MSDEKAVNKIQKEKLGPVPYIAFVVMFLFFSGIMAELAKIGENWAWLGAFDFMTLVGKFGSMATLAEGAGTAASSFRGSGGNGARDGFLFAITLIPAVMLALGTVRVCTNLGALKAAGKLLSPILRPLMGVPGESAVAIVSNLQSTDTGALMTKDLLDKGIINEKEDLILTAFEYANAGVLVNYFSIASAVFAYLEVPLFIPLTIMIVLKVISANLVRFAAGRIVKL